MIGLHVERLEPSSQRNPDESSPWVLTGRQENETTKGPTALQKREAHFVNKALDNRRSTDAAQKGFDGAAKLGDMPSEIG